MKVPPPPTPKGTERTKKEGNSMRGGRRMRRGRGMGRGAKTVVAPNLNAPIPEIIEGDEAEKKNKTQLKKLHALIVEARNLFSKKLEEEKLKKAAEAAGTPVPVPVPAPADIGEQPDEKPNTIDEESGFSAHLTLGQFGHQKVCNNFSFLFIF